MRPHYLPVLTALLAALLYLTPLSFALPNTPQLLKRNQFCVNDPLTVAGTLLSRRLPPTAQLLSSRGNPALITWCAPFTRTYILVRLTTLIPGPSIQTLIESSLLYVAYAARLEHDRLLLGGMYHAQRGVGSPFLRVQNANNHQTTWGVLAAALEALRGFMADFGYGEALFEVWDGENEVGAGVVGFGGSVRRFDGGSLVEAR